MESLGYHLSTPAQYIWVGKPNCTEELHCPFRGKYSQYLLYLLDSHCFKPCIIVNHTIHLHSLCFNGNFECV